MTSTAATIKIHQDLVDETNFNARKLTALVPPSVTLNPEGINGPTPTKISSVGAVSATAPVNDDYYRDTTAKAGEPLPTAPGNRIDTEYDNASFEFDKEIKRDTVMFDKMLKTLYKLVALMKRKEVKANQDYLFNVKIDLTSYAHRIKATYNQWSGMIITGFTVAVAVVGAGAGLSPLAPPNWIAPATAQVWAGSSQALGTLSTAGSSVQQIVTSRIDGERTFLQYEQKRKEDKKDDVNNARHSNKELGKEAQKSIKDIDQVAFDTFGKVGA